jgi:hypothetical protein
MSHQAARETFSGILTPKTADGERWMERPAVCHGQRIIGHSLDLAHNEGKHSVGK